MTKLPSIAILETLDKNPQCLDDKWIKLLTLCLLPATGEADLKTLETMNANTNPRWDSLTWDGSGSRIWPAGSAGQVRPLKTRAGLFTCLPDARGRGIFQHWWKKFPVSFLKLRGHSGVFLPHRHRPTAFMQTRTHLRRPERILLTFAPVSCPASQQH